MKQQFGRSATITDSDIRGIYYTAGGANRTGQTTSQAYAQLVQDTIRAQPNEPIMVIQQDDNQNPRIGFGDVAKTMPNNGQDFIHFIRTNVASTTRLYIPAHLSHVNHFINALWRLPALTGFKIAGFDDAQDRSDVIVVWFQHTQHAQAVGAHFDRVLAQYFSGVYPPGTHRCSAAELCGWSVEQQRFSVGSESTRYLADWWERKGGTVT